MDWLESVVQNYGYVATLIGCFFEGETILLVAAFLAHKGYLRIEWVIAVAAFGSFLGDLVAFWLGSRHAEAMRQKFHFVRRHLPKAQRFFERYGALGIFLMRFSYGLRACTGVVCGIVKMPAVKFVFYAAATCAVWSILIGGAAYLFGHMVAALLDRIAHYEKIVAVILLLAGVIVWMVRYWGRKNGKAQNDEKSK